MKWFYFNSPVVSEMLIERLRFENMHVIQILVDILKCDNCVNIRYILMILSVFHLFIFIIYYLLQLYT